MDSRWAGHACQPARRGVKIYEWLGPMLHAKTMVVDGRFGRIGSSNLNMASLFTNWELDAVVEDEAFGAAMEDRSDATWRRPLSSCCVAGPSAAPVLPAVPSTPGSSASGTVAVRHRGAPAALVARASALVLGVPLRRPYERSPVTLSMMLTVLSLAVAVLGFLYPMQPGWFVAGLCGWLTLGLCCEPRRRSPIRGESLAGGAAGERPCSSPRIGREIVL